MCPFFTYFLFGAVWFRNGLPLGPDIIYCTTYTWHVVMYLCIQSAAAAAAACYCCVLLHCFSCSCCCLLLLFVIVCRMQKKMLLFIKSDCSVLFIFIKTRSIVPLGSTVAFTASTCLLYYIRGNYGYARSQGGRQPTAAKTPLYSTLYYRHPYFEAERGFPRHS